jgi:hypothetical protein
MPTKWMRKPPERQFSEGVHCCSTTWSESNVLPGSCRTCRSLASNSKSVITASIVCFGKWREADPAEGTSQAKPSGASLQDPSSCSLATSATRDVGANDLETEPAWMTELPTERSILQERRGRRRTLQPPVAPAVAVHAEQVGAHCARAQLLLELELSALPRLLADSSRTCALPLRRLPKQEKAPSAGGEDHGTHHRCLWVKYILGHPMPFT